MAHDPQYIKWVQRSLNRLITANVTVDGDPSKKYRDELSRFKTIHSLTEHRLRDDQIGRKCQDTIIQFNNRSVVFDGGAYLGWLCKVVPSAPSKVTGPSDTSLSNAVREFQKQENLKSPDKLEVDGWVGYKTELRLIEKSKVNPPGSVKADTPRPPVDPFVQFLNEMSKERRYRFMMEIVAKRYAEGPWDQRIKDLAKKLRGHETLGIPHQYFFTADTVRHLVYGKFGENDYRNEKGEYMDSNRRKLQKLITKNPVPWGYDYYDLNNPEVQRLVQETFMVSAENYLHRHYAYPFASMEHYEIEFQKFFESVQEIHRKMDIAIGKIKYYRDKEHGDPNARLALNLAKGLSLNEHHIYSAYKDQMPGGATKIENPFPTGRK